MKSKVNFRNYKDSSRQDIVENTYNRMYTEQTIEKRKNWIFPVSNKKSTIKNLLPIFDKLIDDSDPDINIGQINHLLQTYINLKQNFNEDIEIKTLFSESFYNNIPDNIKKIYSEKKFIKNLYPNITDFKNKIMITGFIHDIGKILLHPEWGNYQQHFCVGDIYPLNLPFAKENIFYNKQFHLNNDFFKKNLQYNYTHIKKGFDNYLFTISHDMYLYKVLHNNCKLDNIFLYLIKYHSFYAFHSKLGYKLYASEEDWINLPLLKIISNSDLYSKNEIIPKFEDYKDEIFNLLDKYCNNEYTW
tara:strand:+ start:347 stop:1252 length:906 start_codon:yes stop_codon:yes gene_type:complete